MPQKTTILAKAILFDLDGTLINTIEATEKAYQWLCAQHGVDAVAVVEGCHGVPTKQVLAKYFPPHTHTPEHVTILETRAGEDLSAISPIPGALKLLESLPPHLWVIVTSGTRALATRRLGHLKYPQSVAQMVTAEDIKVGKPDPDGFLLGVSRLGLEGDASGCVVFEDSVAGIQAGKRAGATVIAIRSATGYPESKLFEAGADYVIEHMGQIHTTQSSDGLLSVTLEL